MKPAKHVEVPSWVTAQETQDIMRALNTGAVPGALFVGGCVRNLLLSRPVTDIDIATTHKPAESQALLEAAGIKVIPTGIDHGTVTAVIGQRSFEVTSLRRDVETDGRRAVVAFTTDWLEDAQRRDFTMNTLLMGSDGAVYDPLGRGLTDLEAGRVIFVGEAGARIAEDLLRILRFFRFHAYYGSGAPDPAALQACQNAAGSIAELSRERVTQEFFKILEAPGAGDVLALMLEHDVLRDMLEPAQDYFALIGESGSLPVTCFFLSALEQERVDVLQEYLIFPKKLQSVLKILYEVRARYGFEDMREVKECAYYHGKETTMNAMEIAMRLSEIPAAAFREFRDGLQYWEIPVFPLSGQDLLDAGYPQGPELGQILKRAEQWWVNVGFEGDKEAVLKYII